MSHFNGTLVPQIMKNSGYTDCKGISISANLETSFFNFIFSPCTSDETNDSRSCNYPVSSRCAIIPTSKYI